MLEVIVVIVFIYFLIKGAFKPNLRIRKSPLCLVGKTVLIIAANSKIGYETAVALAGRGCRLIIADEEGCEELKEKIILETGNTNIVAKYLDLASFNSVREFAKDINDTEARLDILINNTDSEFQENNFTEDGLQKAMQINYFGPFLVTHLFVGLLKKSAPSRIIFVSSILVDRFTNLIARSLNCVRRQFRNGLTDLIVHGHLKFGNIITSTVLAEKLKGTGVTSNSLCLGYVLPSFYNNIFFYIYMRYVIGIAAQTPEEESQTILHLALDQELNEVTGKLFMNCKPISTPGPAKDFIFSFKVWKASEEYVHLAPEEKL